MLYAGSLVSPAVPGWARPEAELIDTAALDLEQIRGHYPRFLRRETGGPGSLRGHRPVQRHPGANGNPGKGKFLCRVIPGVTAAVAAAVALAQELTLPEVTQTVILNRAAGAHPGAGVGVPG